MKLVFMMKIENDVINISQILSRYNVSSVENARVNIASVIDQYQIMALKEGIGYIVFNTNEDIDIIIQLYVFDKIKSDKYYINHDLKYIYIKNDNYDDIVRYFIIGGISIVLVVGIIVYTKKKK